MSPPRMAGRLARLATAGLLAVLGTVCGAQEGFPSRPITVISGFATGGSVDVITRVVTDQMSRELGQPMVVNTVAGAGGTIGSARAAQAAPDGYTLLAGSSGSNAAAYGIYRKLPYKPDDFVAVGLMTLIPSLIVVNKNFQVRTLAELVSYARANPGKVSLGHPGTGSSVHLQCEMLKQVAGIDVAMVPYRGAGPLMNDLIGGQITAACDGAPTSTGPLQAKQIRALAVMADQRVAIAPEIPTTVEEGMPTLQGAAWVALFAVRGTPAPVIERLSRALEQSLSNPEVRQRLARLGANVPLSAQSGLKFADQFVRDEIVKWDRVAREAHIPKE